MDWSKGYTATYYMTVVDPATWRDIDRIEITGGTVQREAEGLRQSASINCVNYPQQIEQWVRVWMDTEQAGADDHVALFTGLATSPTQAWDGPVHDDVLEGFSVLKPADDVGLMLGWYAPAGASGGAVIKSLLSVTPAPVEVAEDSPTLESHIIAESGETHLTMVEKILTAIDWRLRITGDGRIHVEPRSSEPVATFDLIENDLIETQISITADWFECPNVFMAVQDDITAIARDETDGPLSIEERGREVWMQESGCELSDNETLEQYAARRLKDEQKTQVTASYGRRYVPDVYPGDKVRLHYPEQGMVGIYTVSSQAIDLQYEARTSEEVTA